MKCALPAESDQESYVKRDACGAYHRHYRRHEHFSLRIQIPALETSSGITSTQTIGYENP